VTYTLAMERIWRAVRLGFFIGLGAANALVAACGRSSAPPDAHAADASRPDAGRPDAPAAAADARAADARTAADAHTAAAADAHTAADAGRARRPRRPDAGHWNVPLE
jgi:hypothetical protein